MPRVRKNPSTYPNRSDLQTATAALPTGQPYGQRQATEANLKVVPISAAGGNGAPPTAHPQSSGFDQAQAHAEAMDFQPVGLDGPSSRPGEPVTAGLPNGAGPGPSSVPPISPAGPSSDLLLWQKYLPALELMAARPDSSMEMRQWYRRLRSQMPPDIWNG